MEFRGNKRAELKCQQGDSRTLVLGIDSCGISSLTAYLWSSR